MTARRAWVTLLEKSAKFIDARRCRKRPSDSICPSVCSSEDAASIDPADEFCAQRPQALGDANNDSNNNENVNSLDSSKHTKQR